MLQVRELVATLQKCRHQAFPVTPEVDAAYQSGETPPTILIRTFPVL